MYNTLHVLTLCVNHSKFWHVTTRINSLLVALKYKWLGIPFMEFLFYHSNGRAEHTKLIHNETKILLFIFQMYVPLYWWQQIPKTAFIYKKTKTNTWSDIPLPSQTKKQTSFYHGLLKSISKTIEDSDPVSQ